MSNRHPQADIIKQWVEDTTQPLWCWSDTDNKWVSVPTSTPHWTARYYALGVRPEHSPVPKTGWIAIGPIGDDVDNKTYSGFCSPIYRSEEKARTHYKGSCSNPIIAVIPVTWTEGEGL